MKATPLLVAESPNQPPEIQKCFVDVYPQALKSNESFPIGGVVVLQAGTSKDMSLQLNISGRVIPVTWGMDSPRMASEYPDSSNGAKARFLSAEFVLDSGEREFSLELVSAQHTMVKLFHFSLAAQEDLSTIHIEPQDRLIMDVGANDGSDTWYYLRKGFRVIAIEAIPDLVADLTATYSNQIEGNRLHITPVAIAENPGKVSFTINEDRSEWSSMLSASKASNGVNRAIEVKADTLGNIIKSFGRPYYVKIDIEGGELAAIKSLRDLEPESLPEFLSFEINNDWVEILEELNQRGYRSFQLVRQGAPYLHTPPTPAREGLDYQCIFTSNMSGPFGLDLPREKWTGVVQLVKEIMDTRNKPSTATNKPGKGGWFDVHASRSLLNIPV